MSIERTSIHGQWSNRFVFILAATGSAVGLGNIWKFPYITGENGGGAFVLVYLMCVAVIGIPIMMAEVMLGRRGRQSPINTMRALIADENKHKYWAYIGWAGVLAGFLILSYYSVIAGWALAYVFRTGAGLFVGATADGVSSIFSNFTSSAETMLAWHTIFMVMTIIVVSRGVKSGLEKAVRFLMPALFILLLILVGYAMNTGEFGKGVDFMFKADFSKISSDGVLTAMGHAFFTLSLGMGAIMVYGSYLPKDTSIASASIVIALLDTLVAILAGLAIFPIVFANNLAPGAGPGLIFETLPIAFGHMPGGTFFGTLFFILLVFAAWSSAISLVEPVIAWLVENKGMSRIKASVWVGITTWLVGIASVFAFSGVTVRDMLQSIWGFFGVTGVQFEAKFFDRSFFDLIDGLTANIMLPLGGLLIAVFASWVMSRQASEDEFAMKSKVLYNIWFVLARYITPVAVIIVFLNVIGVIDWLSKAI